MWCVVVCTADRIRVWDRFISGDTEPCRELVHSNDFARYLSPFKAVWDPKVSWGRRIVLFSLLVTLA